MGMPKEVKQQLVCVLFIILLATAVLFLTLSCATLTPFLSHQKTFDLTIGTETFKVVLPKDFPDMKDAIPSAERCWDALICQKAFCLGMERNHDHIHFWYVPSEEPAAVVWIRDREIEIDKKYKCWIYVKGVPMVIDIKRMNEFLERVFIDKTEKKEIYHGIHPTRNSA